MHFLRALMQWVKGKNQVHRHQRRPDTGPEPLKLLNFHPAGSIGVTGMNRKTHIAVKQLNDHQGESIREKSAGIEKPGINQSAEISYQQTGREDGCDQFVVEIYPDRAMLSSRHPALAGLKHVSSSRPLTLADWVSPKQPGRTAEAWVVKDLLGVFKDLFERNLVVTNMKPESFVFVNGHFMLAASSYVIDCRRPLPSKLEVVPEYTAPELIEPAGHTITPQANLFPLGAIIYFMVCGFQLFQIPQFYDEDEIRHAALKEQKKRLGRKDLFYKKLPNIAQCPVRVQIFIESLLRLDPNKRVSLQKAIGHGWLRQLIAQDQSSHTALKVVASEKSADTVSHVTNACQ